MWGYKKIISLFKFHFSQRVTNNLSEEEMIVLLPAAGNLFIYLRSFLYNSNIGNSMKGGCKKDTSE